MPDDYDCDADYNDDYGEDNGGEHIDRYQYNINDPRTREHQAYKIAQDNHAYARRRLLHGENVDANDKDDTFDEDDEADEDPQIDSLEQQLQNAEEARAWALEYVPFRFQRSALH